MDEILLETNEMEWEDGEAYLKGTMVKVLRDDGDVRTLLMKIPPGFHMNPHSHTTGEQHFIVQGGYETSGWKFGPGTYHCLPAHHLHGPYESRDGAVVLVIWERPDPLEPAKEK